MVPVGHLGLRIQLLTGYALAVYFLPAAAGNTSAPTPAMAALPALLAAAWMLVASAPLLTVRDDEWRRRSRFRARARQTDEIAHR